MNAPRFQFGRMLKDVVTGYQGIATSRIEFMTGCTQYGLTPAKVSGKAEDDRSRYFDETRLMEMKKGHVTLPTPPANAPEPKKGGPAFEGAPARYAGGARG